MTLALVGPLARISWTMGIREKAATISSGRLAVARMSMSPTVSRPRRSFRHGDMLQPSIFPRWERISITTGSAELLSILELRFLYLSMDFMMLLSLVGPMRAGGGCDAREPPLQLLQVVTFSLSWSKKTVLGPRPAIWSSSARPGGVLASSSWWAAILPV